MSISDLAKEVEKSSREEAVIDGGMVTISTELFDALIDCMHAAAESAEGFKRMAKNLRKTKKALGHGP